MRRRDKPLDIYKKLQIVRTMEELVLDDEGTASIAPEKTGDSDNLKLAGTTKKKLNIPVGDVKVDPIIDTVISPDYSIPASYVRHTKKIGDEEDPTIDYCLEDDDREWIANHPVFGAENSVLMIELVEKVFNVLERNTGAGDPVDMITADKLVSQLVTWKTKPPSLAGALLEIYQRWIYKRASLHRPLCRRYWPLTSPTDTNPHNVFRPREKERYRLRKHRKNDLHSFRKLQSLRRELGKARVILQLVLERELMKQAQLDLKSRIFECRLEIEEDSDDNNEEPETEEAEAEVGNEDTDRKEEVSDLMMQCRYRPRFEHLMPVRDPDSNIGDGLSIPFLDEREKDFSGSGLRLTLSLKSQSQSFGLSHSGLGSSESFKKQSGRPRKRDFAAVEGPEGVAITPAIPAATPRPRQRTSHGHASAPKGEQPAMPASPWPSFLEPLCSRQPLFVCRGMGGGAYMRELEVSPDRFPSKFRCRGRVGRGGRVVMDRVPVYDSDSDSNLSCFLPTQLCSVPAQLAHQRVAELLSHSASAADQMVLSLRPSTSALGQQQPRERDLSLDQLQEVSCLRSALSSLPSFPLFFPPERPAMSYVATAEEREILANSDSEDELLELHATGCRTAPVSKIIDPSAVRYSLLDV